jgi:hypothetical protein
MIRLQTDDDDRAAGLGRAENLRPVASGDKLWDILNVSRPASESFNA